MTKISKCVTISNAFGKVRPVMVEANVKRMRIKIHV